MEFFTRAKAVRLKSQHNKYLVAADDEESVKQSRNGSSKNARWSVEPVDNKPNVIRLKSCHSWKYLGATDDPFLLGMTGRRVAQTSPKLRLDTSVEWEPIKQGSHVKLRTRKGNFLRANGGIPPWNNSVTHDIPSRSSTQEWILWTVDVLEVDYQSTESTTETKNPRSVIADDNNAKVEDYGSLSRNSSSGSTISKADYFKDCYEVGSDDKRSSLNQVKQSNLNDNVDNNVEDHEHESLSRKSSLDSTVSKAEVFKDWSENEVVTPHASKSVRSVRRVAATQLPTQSPKASPQKSEKPAQVSPFGRHVQSEPKHSDSFNKLKSALDGLDDLLDDDYEHDAQSEENPEPAVESPVHKPHALEVKMAKHALREVEDLDYEAFLSSGKEKKVEDAVKVLIADVKMSGRGQVPKELENIRDQLKSMREDHESASQDIEEGTAFSIRRLEVKSELKKDALKAHELEALEVELSNELTKERARREELLRQLEEVENTIKVTETAKADNDAEIDEIVSRIGEKRESLREMERKEKSWQARKVDAERKLERVEEDWAKMQSMFEEV